MKKATIGAANNTVQSMRVIRDEISNEIKDMTFAEERAYLDRLLLEGVSNDDLNSSERSNKSRVA